MKTKTLWRVHSWLGLLAGLPLLLIALSGSILVFKDELDGLLRPGEVRAEPLPGGRLSYDELHRKAAAALPEHETVGWAIYHGEPARADFLYVMEHGEDEFLNVHLNPYTGALLHPPHDLEDSATGWLLSLHFRLLGGHLGEAVTGIIALMLCMLGITGFMIYRKFWKGFLTFRWKTGWRTLSGNLHKRIGALFSPVFLLLGLTGAWWNIAHIVEDLRQPEEPMEDGEIHGGHLRENYPFDRILAESREHIPNYVPNYISFPFHPGEPVRLFGAYEQQNPLRSPYHSQVHFDSETTAHLSTIRIEETGLWPQILDSFTPLHFGTFGGLPVKILWCVVGASPGFLALSGAFVWWRRRPVRRG